MAKKQARVDFETHLVTTTPACVSRYPRLNTPDTMWDADGRYETQLVLDTSKPDHAAFLEQLEELWAEAIEEAVNLVPKWAASEPRNMASKPWKQDEEDPALYVLRPKMKAKKTQADGTMVDRRPPLFDTTGAPIPADQWIKGGSILRANILLSPFLTPKIGFGIAVYLRAVQVVKAVETDSAEAYGFDATPAAAADGPTASWDEDFEAAG